MITKAQNTKHKIPKTNHGITLIALVITIIVMLILVAVTITMAVNGGLFGKASSAGKQTNEAVRKEQELGSGKVNIAGTMYNSPQEYVDELTGGTGNKFVEKNTPYTTGEGENKYTAIIPQGFKISDEKDEQTIHTGLVIQDAKGNEFVWIPVTYTASGTKDANGLDSGFLNTFKRSTTSNSYSEPCTSGYTKPTTEAADYYDMMLSVQNNGGFYVGRYEAGIEPTYIDENGQQKTHQARTNIANDTTLPVVVKRDCFPYNYVGWGGSMSSYTSPILTEYGESQGYGAVKLSKDLLNGQTTGATSTLMYGVQWDAMLKFMGKENDTNSSSWGNYKGVARTISRETAKYTTSPYSDTTWTPINKTTINTSTFGNGVLLTTGAHDDFGEKNIYDVAGNVYEWTMETYTSKNLEEQAPPSGVRVRRGGSYLYDGVVYPAPDRDYDVSPNKCNYNIGFRPTLYITNK